MPGLFLVDGRRGHWHSITVRTKTNNWALNKIYSCVFLKKTERVVRIFINIWYNIIHIKTFSL